MYCTKCGTKAIDGAVFCQKCGAKLIRDNRKNQESVPVHIQEPGAKSIPSGGTSSEQKCVKEEESALKGEPIQVSLPELIKTSTFSTEAIMKTAQKADIPKEPSSTSERDAGLYALLEENIDSCPIIKSAKQVKKGVRLRGKVYSHTVRLVTVHAVQARIRSGLAFPFSILYGVLAGLLCTISVVILQELVKYGSICIEYYHGILVALCCLTIGAIVFIHSFVGRKEKSAVAAYVRDTAEPRNISLFIKKGADMSKIRIAVAGVLGLTGILLLLFNLPAPIEYPDELLFGGLPVTRFLDMTQKDLESEFGEAKWIGQNMTTGDDYYNYSYDGFDGISHVVYSKKSGKVIYIQFDAIYCTCNRKKLNKSTDRVLDILSERYGGYYSFGVYGSIHNGFYYDGVYFGERPGVEEYMAQQEVEDGRDWNYRFMPLNVYGEVYYDASLALDVREKQDYKIDLIVEVWKNRDDLDGVYNVCLYTDEWIEAVNTGNGIIDLSYRGESLVEWIGDLPENAYDVFGWPDSGTIVDGYLYNGGEYFGYNDGVIFVMDYQTGQIRWIMGDAGSIIGNGSALDKTRDELIEILGTPEMEEDVYDDMNDTNIYYMQYTLNGAELLINMPDSASRAETVIISQIVE